MKIDININNILYNKMTDRWKIADERKKYPFDNVYVAENAIRTLIQKDNNCSAHFEYKYDGKARGNTFHRLDLITLNPTHQTHFLLHSIIGEDDKLYLMNQMYDYVYNLKNSMKKKDTRDKVLNYTVSWWDGKKTVTSYFSGRSINEVMNKINYGKTELPIIYSITLSSET